MATLMQRHRAAREAALPRLVSKSHVLFIVEGARDVRALKKCIRMLEIKPPHRVASKNQDIYGAPVEEQLRTRDFEGSARTWSVITGGGALPRQRAYIQEAVRALAASRFGLTVVIFTDNDPGGNQIRRELLTQIDFTGASVRSVRLSPTRYPEMANPMERVRREARSVQVENGPAPSIQHLIAARIAPLKNDSPSDPSQK